MNRLRNFFGSLLVISSLTFAADTPRVFVGEFSRLTAGTDLPSQWRVLTSSRIKRHTQYSLKTIDGVTALHAHAEASMSSLATEASIDPASTPWLHWRWRIAAANPASSLNSKQNDDFAARIYVFFDFDLDRLPFIKRTKLRLARAIYGDQLPLAALCYVWANKEPVGTAAWSAYTDRVRMIVATTGNELAGRGWVEVERDIVDDYRAAFGEPVPRITGIALATDTDNTATISDASYGDLYFSGEAKQERP